MSAPVPRLVPFDPAHAALVLSWARTAGERRRWASLDASPEPEIFARWLAEAGTFGHLLTGDRITGEAPIAYGELWVSESEREVELAHLIVAPAHRNRGVGRTLVEHLVEEAGRFRLSSAWVRVVPENVAARRCYEAAGFAAVDEKTQATLNAPQPRRYRWLRREI